MRTPIILRGDRSSWHTPTSNNFWLPSGMKVCPDFGARVPFKSCSKFAKLPPSSLFTAYCTSWLLAVPGLSLCGNPSWNFWCTPPPTCFSYVSKNLWTRQNCTRHPSENFFDGQFYWSWCHNGSMCWSFKSSAQSQWKWRFTISCGVSGEMDQPSWSALLLPMS